MYVVCMPSTTLMLHVNTRSFGKVCSGQDVLNAIEEVGSNSGKTRVPVEIADSGQLR